MPEEKHTSAEGERTVSQQEIPAAEPNAETGSPIKKEDQNSIEEAQTPFEEQLTANAKRNQKILKRTAVIERAILIALTLAFVVALIVMGVRFL